MCLCASVFPLGAWCVRVCMHACVCVCELVLLRVRMRTSNLISHIKKNCTTIDALCVHVLGVYVGVSGLL